MIRTIVVVLALGVAVLFLPLWVQLLLFLIAVWVTPYRLPLVIPAVLADVLYGPSGTLSIMTLKLTAVVMVLILIRWLLLTQTRLASVIYGMEA